MIYQIRQHDTIQSIAKRFGYEDYKQFFKTMRYIKGHVFLPGNIVEAPSIPGSTRDRPYDGQPHTDHGERGMTFVEGLTMRDINDCYRKAILLSTGDHELNKLVADDAWQGVNVYEDVDWDSIDPIAIGQNLTCEIERMMGIFPNVPELFNDRGEKLT